MKQKCSSRKVQIDPAVKLLQECLKNYSSGLDRATLTCSNYDDCCALSTDGLVFVLYYIDDKTRVQVQTFFPRTRSLSKSCVQQLLQEDHVEVEFNDSHQARLAASMESSILHDCAVFEGHINRFVLASRKAKES